ncbi:hypothetical protein NPIL_301211, partial [Nephila pilipes]
MIGADFRQGESTDFKNIQAVLKDAFSAGRDSTRLEVESYSAKQWQNQSPTDFVYFILKISLWLNLTRPET